MGAGPTRDLDPERRLALAYIPIGRRAQVETLWRLDVTLGDTLAPGRDPMIGQIRLAWWREALERLDHDKPPPEPLLEAAERFLLPGGITGAMLAGMADGWEALLDGAPLTPDMLERYSARGALLFRLSANLLGADSHSVAQAGSLWALVDFARHCARPDEAAMAIEAARAKPDIGRWPISLRPLGMLAALAARDARRGRPEPQGSPSRMIRMAAHRLTGR